MENHNKAETSILVHKCDSEVNADLEDERRLYEQLKEKFEAKPKNELELVLEKMKCPLAELLKKKSEKFESKEESEIRDMTKQLLSDLSERLKEKALDLEFERDRLSTQGDEWISVKDGLPGKNEFRDIEVKCEEKFESLINKGKFAEAVWQGRARFVNSGFIDDRQISMNNIVTYWRYKNRMKTNNSIKR
jgi:hypothetical protein